MMTGYKTLNIESSLPAASRLGPLERTFVSIKITLPVRYDSMGDSIS